MLQRIGSWLTSCKQTHSTIDEAPHPWILLPYLWRLWSKVECSAFCNQSTNLQCIVKLMPFAPLPPTLNLCNTLAFVASQLEHARSWGTSVQQSPKAMLKLIGDFCIVIMFFLTTSKDTWATTPSIMYPQNTSSDILNPADKQTYNNESKREESITIPDNKSVEKWHTFGLSPLQLIIMWPYNLRSNKSLTWKEIPQLIQHNTA